MEQINPAENSFLIQLKEIILEKISNEDFGVEELAKEVGMSRTSLYRRVRFTTGQSVSEFIREVRLLKAHELLKDKSITASEVAYKVGFRSPSYFNKCFHDHYGYPPGEVKKQSQSGKSVSKMSPDAVDESNPQEYLMKKSMAKRLILFVVPIVLILIYLLGFVLPDRASGTGIVVLPFKNLASDLETEYFADAIMDGILAQLSAIEGLSVRSRTTSDYIGERSMPVKQICKEVKARYILEGSVQTSGDRVRITVQFIDGRKDTHIWSENYDREYADLLEIQSDITLEVADRMHISLSESESRIIDSYSSQNPEVWDNYLRGRFLINKADADQRIDISPEALKKSLKYFARAIELDSSFALAYAGMAKAYSNLAGWNWLPDRKEGMLKAQEYTSRALELDPQCAEALTVQAGLYVWGGLQRDFEKGRVAYQKALRIKPDYPPALQQYAQLLMITGPIEEARNHMNRLIEQEPYFWLMHNLDAWIYYFEEKHVDALKACGYASELKPDWPITHWLYFLNYVKLGKGVEAMEYLQRIVQADPRARTHAEEIRTYYNSEGIEGLFKFLIHLNNTHPGVFHGINGAAFFNGWWYALLGDKEESLKYLQKALQRQDSSYTYFIQIAVNPDFDFMRSDPRFLDIIEKLGLTPYNTRTNI